MRNKLEHPRAQPARAWSGTIILALLKGKVESRARRMSFALLLLQNHPSIRWQASAYSRLSKIQWMVRATCDSAYW